MAAPLLSASKVTKRFGGLTAVSAVDFEIPEKSIVSIIGPNGAGKTTFFNCITGFGKADEGTITFEGTEIQKLRPDQIARLGISRTYQNIRLFAAMTALENILVGEHEFLHATWLGAIFRSKRMVEEEKAALQEAQRLLNFVGLKGKGDMVARSLPYGEQRRLEIARALATKPKLLLLDEPSAGMNPRESEDLTAFIRRLRDELGITILLIEHHMRVVMGISETVTVLDYGEKIAEGTPAEIQSNTRVPDIIPCNEWQTGLVPAYLKTLYRDDPFYRHTRSVFTIHNMAYQGVFPKSSFAKTGLPAEVYTDKGLEHHGSMNMLKAGLVYADALTTVSEKYAEEIRGSEEFGFGLQEVVARRKDSLSGILNGIEYSVWNPAVDEVIQVKYDPRTLNLKAENKRALQERMGLPARADVPLLGVISRLADPKGFDLLEKILPEMMTMDLQLVVLGTGQKEYHTMLEKAAKKYPQKMAVMLGFDDELAHWMGKKPGCL